MELRSLGTSWSFGANLYWSAVKDEVSMVEIPLSLSFSLAFFEYDIYPGINYSRLPFLKLVEKVHEQCQVQPEEVEGTEPKAPEK